MAQNKTPGMLDAIVMFQDGEDLEPTHNLFSIYPAAHEHTEHPTTE